MPARSQTETFAAIFGAQGGDAHFEKTAANHGLKKADFSFCIFWELIFPMTAQLFEGNQMAFLKRNKDPFEKIVEVNPAGIGNPSDAFLRLTDESLRAELFRQ